MAQEVNHGFRSQVRRKSEKPEVLQESKEQVGREERKEGVRRSQTRIRKWNI